MENNNTQWVGTTALNNRTMNRKGPFIRFDIAMLNSLDMTLVRQKYGIEGWGIVLYIMKCLLERHTDCRAPLPIVPEIAYVCHKSKRTILQLIRDFPALFEIEPDGQTFTSPYLLQLFVKCSAKNEKSNRSLNKLTNEAIDNQSVNVPKNNEQEQEQKKTTKRVEKVDDVADVGKLMERDTETKPSDTSPNPSEGGERTPLANSVFLQISSRRNSRIQTYKRLARPIFFRISPQTFPRIQACKRLAHSKSLHMTPQTSPRIRTQKRLARSTSLAVFTARADAMQHSPGPQARAPSLWEGRGRFLEGQAGFLGGPK
ncbi:hypothetical protein [Segatella maculosa]|uniref:hypothetical protein n=1 Tax=Segatella maculosa TaxID=439703 RepID=UPI0028D24664|nr:hypothetical protein [Segatella maculosa]